MARVPRRNALRAVCVAAAAATGGGVSLTAGGVGGRRPGALVVTNRDDRSRTVDVCAKPAAAGESIPRTTVRLDAGESRVRDGFVGTAGRYVVEVRRGGENERVLAETTVTYERTDRGTLRGDAIEVVIESGGAVAVSPTG